MTELWEIGLVIAATFVNGGAPILLKMGMKNVSIKKLLSLVNWKIVGGIFLYGLSYIMTIPAFKSGDISILYPILSLAYIWVALLSIKYLGEKMNLLKWGGITLIIVGVVFLTVGR
jgi:multidrug transporter EmrE-like cation transporter